MIHPNTSTTFDKINQIGLLNLMDVDDYFKCKCGRYTNLSERCCAHEEDDGYDDLSQDDYTTCDQGHTHFKIESCDRCKHEAQQLKLNAEEMQRSKMIAQYPDLIQSCHACKQLMFISGATGNQCPFCTSSMHQSDMLVLNQKLRGQTVRITDKMKEQNNLLIDVIFRLQHQIDDLKQDHHLHAQKLNNMEADTMMSRIKNFLKQRKALIRNRTSA